MTGALKVIALISGGKDSLFSILHCIANGHDVVALANLHPPLHLNEDVVDDTDSYMYQTIGHAIIPLYEHALGLPLYRQEITGTAVNQAKCYGPVSPGTSRSTLDETESLMPLLQSVVAAHPEVNAVSTGAILSDYQRTRVESIALRLGLIPLSYLWQWPSLPPHSEASLLQDMAAVGQDSRIIKVASGGLDESFLWKNVAEASTVSRLAKAAQRFGSLGDGAVLGEGGEYETLCLNGPAPLWTSEIVVEEAQRQLVLGEAGSASLHLTQPRLVSKDNSGTSMSNLRIPALLDERFSSLLEELLSSNTDVLGDDAVANDHTLDFSSCNESVSDAIIFQDGHAVLIPNLTSKETKATEQMRAIMGELSEKLTELNHQMTDIVYTTIIMRDIADFPAINKIYGTFFPDPNPPARVTIACPDVLPAGASLAVAATSVRSSSKNPRTGLHVQSRSYWAPANIGPYSQAISVPVPPTTRAFDVVYVAGQIPLVPSSMELVRSPSNTVKQDFIQQTVLSLQHLHRIGRRLNVRQWTGAIVFIVCRSSEDTREAAGIARHAWESFHRVRPDMSPGSDDESPDFDVWHVKHGNQHRPFQSRSTREDTTRPSAQKLHSPPLHVVVVNALPRASNIEWAGYGITIESSQVPKVPHMHYLSHIFRDCTIR